MPFLELRGITKTFFQGELEVKVLKGVSLSVERGEFVAIMGPSGSGKSTLMYILGCLDKPTSGEYYLDGKDVLKMSDDELSRLRSRYIGFVFQAFYLVPYLSVLDNVMLPVEYLDSDYRKELFSGTSPEERAKEILERLGLSEKIHFKPDQLSGGQKQRVAIARALMNSPEIILADEPTGQLDTESGKAVMELLSELNREGRTVIVVTHDPAVASYAKRVIRIKDGQVVE
jgi:putative ABC transport system ATP-binding protein